MDKGVRGACSCLVEVLVEAEDQLIPTLDRTGDGAWPPGEASRALTQNFHQRDKYLELY